MLVHSGNKIALTLYLFLCLPKIPQKRRWGILILILILILFLFAMHEKI